MNKRVIREISRRDAEALARLHSESWRCTYRGLLRDAYLDGPVFDEHRALWLGRTSQPQPAALGLAACDEDGDVEGFVFALRRHHETLGAYLDNLHVSPAARGRGIGSRLLLALSERLLHEADDAGLYLWAYEGNLRARRYYERLGALAVERAEDEAPGGGQLAEWLYRWKSIAELRRALAG